MKKTEKVARAQMVFQLFDVDGDGYHNLQESQALGRALEGVAAADHDVDADEFAAMCVDLGANPDRGVSLANVTEIYTDPTFGADIEHDYAHLFGDELPPGETPQHTPQRAAFAPPPPSPQVALTSPASGVHGKAVAALVDHHRSRSDARATPLGDSSLLGLSSEQVAKMPKSELLRYTLQLRAEVQNLATEYQAAWTRVAAEQAWGNELALNASGSV